MTNYNGEPEFYHYDPDRKGVVPWARMSRDARATWGLLCLQYRMPLDPSGARHDVRARVVMHVVESQVPVPLRTDVDPRQDGKSLARRSMAIVNVQPEAQAIQRVRMVWGDRVREVEALVDDDRAGARAAALRSERGKAARKRDDDERTEHDEGRRDAGEDGEAEGPGGGEAGAGREAGGADGPVRGRRPGGLLGGLRGFLGRR